MSPWLGVEVVTRVPTTVQERQAEEGGAEGGEGGKMSMGLWT